MSNSIIIDEVIKYYGSTVIDFKIFWSRSKDLALHCGYYDDGVKNHKDSLLKMNEILAKFADISKNDSILDAGCGYGGSAIWLAKNIGCEVVGITVFPYHVSEAKKYAKKYGVSDKVSFREEDYAHTSFSNGSFNVVWGLESIVHAESKKDFIHEAHRLLKKGGRILISEYMFRENPYLSADEKKFF